MPITNSTHHEMIACLWRWWRDRCRSVLCFMPKSIPTHSTSRRNKEQNRRRTLKLEAASASLGTDACICHLFCAPTDNLSHMPDRSNHHTDTRRKKPIMVAKKPVKKTSPKVRVRLRPWSVVAYSSLLDVSYVARGKSLSGRLDAVDTRCHIAYARVSAEPDRTLIRIEITLCDNRPLIGCCN